MSEEPKMASPVDYCEAMRRWGAENDAYAVQRLTWRPGVRGASEPGTQSSRDRIHVMLPPKRISPP